MTNLTLALAFAAWTLTLESTLKQTIATWVLTLDANPKQASLGANHGDEARLAAGGIDTVL